MIRGESGVGVAQLSVDEVNEVDGVYSVLGRREVYVCDFLAECVHCQMHSDFSSSPTHCYLRHCPRGMPFLGAVALPPLQHEQERHAYCTTRSLYWPGLPPNKRSGEISPQDE